MCHFPFVIFRADFEIRPRRGLEIFVLKFLVLAHLRFSISFMSFRPVVLRSMINGTSQYQK
jgi:hypothetical protein